MILSAKQYSEDGTNFYPEFMFPTKDFKPIYTAWATIYRPDLLIVDDTTKQLLGKTVKVLNQGGTMSIVTLSSDEKDNGVYKNLYYAHPNSVSAREKGFERTGCYYICLEGIGLSFKNPIKDSSHQTKEETIGFGNTITNQWNPVQVFLVRCSIQ